MLVPMVPSFAHAGGTEVRAREVAPCTAEEVAFAARLRGLEALVVESGSGCCVLDGGLVLRFAARTGLRSEIARWILDTGTEHRNAEWRLTRNRHGDVVVTLQCSGDVLAFVSAHLPSIARLPRI